MKIKPDLSPRNHLFARFYKLDQMLFGLVVIELGIVGMHSDRGKHTWVLFCDRNGPPKIVGIRIARADIQHHRNTRINRSLYHLITVHIKLLAVYVAMGID